jgi:dTDP-4-amino-4,6-dideoxygalactose transaminase
MTRFLPPAGMPLEVKDFVAGMRALIHPATDGMGSVTGHTGARHAFGMGSGRAGLVVIFRALRRLSPERSILALPGYTCYSVAAAAVRAGLKIYPMEMDPATLDIDYRQAEQLPYDKLLAVLTANLFGFASDIPKLRELAAGSGAWVVDDAAQSLGTCTGDQLSGTGADVGLYSLARGKALPVGGGVIVTDRDEIASVIECELQRVPPPGLGEEMKTYLGLLGVSVLFRPWLYWIPNRLPFLKLGMTEFEPEFPLARMSRVSAGMLPGRLAQLGKVTGQRAEKAARLKERLQDVPGFQTPDAPPGCSPSYIRFPVLARSRQARDWVVQELKKAGIGASAYYPAAVCDIPEVAPHLAAGVGHRPGAEQLARTILTLPLHSMVRDRDLDQMADVLKQCPN